MSKTNIPGNSAIHTDDEGKIELSEQQVSPSKSRPEDFSVFCEDYDKPVSVTGQRENSPAAQKRAPKDKGSNYQDAPEKP
jgi:hypothetical protein